MRASRGKDPRPGAWQVAPLQRFSWFSRPRSTNGRPEPLFIPRLQSRFADFPWPRYLLTRGFLPWRPDAVISTAPAHVAQPVLRHLSALRAPVYAGAFSPGRVLLAVNASTRVGALDRCDGPTAPTERLRAVPSVAELGRACRALSLLPFRRLYGRSRALRTESPADCFSGRGILLLFSGLYTD